MDILLCDDHRLLLDAMSTSLVGRGHRVVGTTTDPSTLVRLVRDLSPDLCVVDVGFPGCSGIDAAREVIEQVPNSRVLMLSACADALTVRRSLDAGAVGFVCKDDGVEGLLGAIAQLERGVSVVQSRAFSPVRSASPPRPAPKADWLEGCRLTARERDVLDLVVDGKGTAEIVATLDIAVSTARTHIQNVLMKTGCHTRLQLAAVVRSHGSIPDPDRIAG